MPHNIAPMALTLAQLKAIEDEVALEDKNKHIIL
jgi:hypothetical protein